MKVSSPHSQGPDSSLLQSQTLRPWLQIVDVSVYPKIRMWPQNIQKLNTLIDNKCTDLIDSSQIMCVLCVCKDDRGIFIISNVQRVLKRRQRKKWLSPIWNRAEISIITKSLLELNVLRNIIWYCWLVLSNDLTARLKIKKDLQTTQCNGHISTHFIKYMSRRMDVKHTHTEYQSSEHI